MKNHSSTKGRPIAHIVVEDAACRAAIIETLDRRGWEVVEQPTGLAARGCSGLSIARGLRDLGSRIPVVVVARAADELLARRDGPLTIVAPENVTRTLELLSSRRSGLRKNPSVLNKATA